VYDRKYNVADAGYFRRAVHYMMQKFSRRQLVFVVCSDELSWARRNFPSTVDHVTNDFNRSAVSNTTTKITTTPGTTTKLKPVVAFSSPSHSPAEDLAILRSCNHTIMSVGSFGWWAGYLAGGTTVYYREYIRRNGSLMPHFSHDDYYPPDWVGF